MKNFKALRIWQNGMEIASLAYALTGSFPAQEKFNLGYQITKSAVSIPSNIAEGSGRLSEREYRRFLEIALGSGFELETQILIAENAGFGEKELRGRLLQLLEIEHKMLISFINKL